MSTDVIPDTVSLAYSLPHEAWYASPELPNRRGLHIVCRRDRDSVTIWDVTLTEQVDGLLAIEGQSNSWEEFARSCAVLAHLTGGRAVNISAMRAALDSSGVTDETVRTGPYAALAG